MTAVLGFPFTVTVSSRPPCSHCHAEATHKAFYRPQGGCPHTERLYCLRHADQIRALEADENAFRCSLCRQVKELVRMEPLP